MAPRNTNIFARPTDSNHWQDWVNLILGIWLFISPWVLDFAPGRPIGTAGNAPPNGVVAYVVSAAAWNAWIFGVIVAVISIAALIQLQRWAEWLNLLIGIWIAVSPWVLGFAGRYTSAAMWDLLVVGVLIFALAAWDLWTIRGKPTVSSV